MNLMEGPLDRIFKRVEYNKEKVGNILDIDKKRDINKIGKGKYNKYNLKLIKYGAIGNCKPI
jgi:hypothetical protein